MKLKPVDNYENPKYSSYKLKTGALLPIGIAVLAAIGLLSGCTKDTQANNNGGQGKQIEEPELLMGDVAYFVPPTTQED